MTFRVFTVHNFQNKMLKTLILGQFTGKRIISVTETVQFFEGLRIDFFEMIIGQYNLLQDIRGYTWRSRHLIPYTK